MTTRSGPGRPDISTAVITVTHRRRDHLRRQRLGLAGEPVVHFVVGIDEAPPEAGAFPDTPVIGVPIPSTPLGLPLAAARNAGAAAALDREADLLVFLDVDCIPGPGLIAGYATAAVRTDGPALLCGPVAYLPPAPPGGYPLEGLDGLADPHTGRPVPGPGRLVAEPRLELFWSLSFAVTAATWRRLGGFHEGYVGYGAEDTHFALTAGRLGASLVWVGGAIAYHQHHPPSRRQPARLAEIVRNARLFHSRHGSWPMTTWLDELAADGLVDFDRGRGALTLSVPAVNTPTAGSDRCGPAMP